MRVDVGTLTGGGGGLTLTDVVDDRARLADTVTLIDKDLVCFGTRERDMVPADNVVVSEGGDAVSVFRSECVVESRDVSVFVGKVAEMELDTVM